MEELNGEGYREELQKDIFELPRVPFPIYRHATPSSPWPWMDSGDDREALSLPPSGLGKDPEWDRYPRLESTEAQTRLMLPTDIFNLRGLGRGPQCEDDQRNWTHDQIQRCGILKSTHNKICMVHKVDVFDDGTFDRSEDDSTFTVNNPRAYWNRLQIPPPSDIRVRALFVENMTVPMLQILGTKYNIEPFFFASSANWIPSRYQEDPKEGEDHITVILPFIRIVKNQKPISRTRPVRARHFPLNLLEIARELLRPYKDEKQFADTQVPFFLPDHKILLQDLLAIHMHRTPKTSTIISYHPSELQRTSAKRLRSLVQRICDNLHWSKIFVMSKDPTFLFLANLWYALYAWDEAFEVLGRYINNLESDVLKYNDIRLTRELHKLQAHLLYYQQLLRDFKLSVEFVRDTPNPAMSVLASTPEELEDSKILLHKEIDGLMSEIDRLSGQRLMLSDRLLNAIHLAFACVDIEDGKAMKSLMELIKITTVSMKQIAYLMTIFLPASFLANVFSMNVTKINPPTYGSLTHYIEITTGLTILTSWIVISLQSESTFHPRRSSIIRRAFWPIFYAFDQVSAAMER